MQAPEWVESEDALTVLAFETDSLPNAEATATMHTACNALMPSFLRQIDTEDNSQDIFVSEFHGDKRFVMEWVFPGILDSETIGKVTSTLTAACEKHALRCRLSDRGSEF
ncbi:MAG: hypothetical protein R3F39_24675 [Myxococcota bacterium]